MYEYNPYSIIVYILSSFSQMQKFKKIQVEPLPHEDKEGVLSPSGKLAIVGV